MARRTFFSFEYKPDVWRAWNVRNCWKIKTTDEPPIDGFFDSSVFEAKEKESPDALKTFLRDGLKNSSVTCVLTGTSTWSRRWVRYEIVQSVLKGNGLLTVDIDGVEDTKGETSTKGPNPLDNVGLYKSGESVYFAEWRDRKWVKYDDYTRAVDPSILWFPSPTTDNVVALSNHYKRYCFSTGDGRKNLATWIENAAKAAGR